jgi:hypothetical protein
VKAFSAARQLARGCEDLGMCEPSPIGKCIYRYAGELEYIAGFPWSCVLFITAVPNTKLCAWGEEDSGGHVL